MVENFDNSGINSLGGFVFQIDTFILYALKLNPGEYIEYESIEDVSIRKPNDLDLKEDFFRTNLNLPDLHTVIQVKRKNITNETVERVLMNWILLKNSSINIDKYILLGNNSYSNNGSIRNINNNALFEKIKASSNRSKKSILKKLKDIYSENYEQFNEDVNSIKDKYEFIEKISIEDDLVDGAKDLFHKDGVFNPVYIARIEALRSKISFAILEAIKEKQPYKLEYVTFRKIIEEISSTITDEFPIISFSDHKKLHPIHIQDIENLREVKQLRACNLGDNDIVRRMYKCNYYTDYQYKLKEQARISTLEDIETTTFDNFEEVKERLSQYGQDEPYKRLTETEDKENSSCYNEHIRKGVCIYLTKDIDITRDKQISWKDEADE